MTGDLGDISFVNTSEMRNSNYKKEDIMDNSFREMQPSIRQEGRRFKRKGW